MLFPTEDKVPECPVCGCLMIKSRNVFTHEKCWECPNLKCKFEVPLEWEDE